MLYFIYKKNERHHQQSDYRRGIDYKFIIYVCYLYRIFTWYANILGTPIVPLLLRLYIPIPTTYTYIPTDLMHLTYIFPSRILNSLYIIENSFGNVINIILYYPYTLCKCICNIHVMQMLYKYVLFITVKIDNNRKNAFCRNDVTTHAIHRMFFWFSAKISISFF